MTVNDTPWLRVPIKEVYQGLYDGPHATPPVADDGPVFLGIGNVTDDGHLNLSSIRHIAEADFPNWTKRVVPQSSDIVFTYEATLNRYAMIPEGFRGCLGRRMALIRPDPQKVEPRFLFYYFFGYDWRQTVAANILSGATVDRIPLTSFPDFPISLPPLPTQQRIAAILSTYDDLIENNTRRIAILEEMARRFYYEWFVRFRFPGHEAAEFDGELPTGWARIPLSQIAEFKRGKQQLTKKAYVEEGFTAYSASGPDGLLESWEVETKAVVVSGVGAYCGKTWLARGKWTCIANTFYLRPTSPEVSAELLYMATFGIDFWPRRGAAQPFISTGDAGTKEIVVATPQVMKAFNQTAVPMLDLIATLQRKNANLRTQRDLLLPKLVSGEIDVSGAEVVLEAAE
ncbi:restriction endonuclease subunit S [Roseovarius nubinhibens]|uniref:restriction endonuclease subunit S n=1 Tax=Roseovarius nubinhibens TaxID=314263 RepID=UPI001C082439|nr:restriction endonuclease subunit S [Roseovarius nubinhibens]MBU3000020.1 restriction endonuclease subunit S [Roseovarius nubinhibens]